MYCEKCKKQSPENFKHCAYCGATFNRKKVKSNNKEDILTLFKKRYKLPSMKSRVISLVIIASVLALAAIITGLATGSKPDALVKTFTKAIELNDAELFYTLFDDQIKSYNKEYLYFDDEVVLTEMTTSMRRSNDFYKGKCGEEFKLTYKIDSVEYMSESELEEINDYLSETYTYEKLAKKGAKLSFTILASGKEGDYQSIYSDVNAIRIGSKWYLCSKTQ